jgi:hypothetical protein
MRKKSQLNSEKIWKIQKKSKDFPFYFSFECKKGARLPLDSLANNLAKLFKINNFRFLQSLPQT